MNLGDPELELIDPTPNVHALFVHFDKLFFWTSLASRAIVRWSKRMYSCAGTCSYDRVGLCEIALSEPLLKLRPRKDLIETLLHEMIHAYLFITKRDRDRDGHGPNFKEHMYRINKKAGLNISIYHNFHDEVRLYQTHWWRCNGPCQNRRPYFGVVRRTVNRAPGPTDRWWLNHQRNCGGTFVKIKEPEQQIKSKPKKQNGDITKYINTKTDKPINTIQNDKSKSILKDSNMNSKSKSITSFVNNNTLVVNKKNVIFNPKAIKATIEPFTGAGKTLGTEKNQSISDITETVRNIWANKFLTSSVNNKKLSNNTTSVNSNKHKAIDTSPSPPKKIMKIDDYFKSSVTTILKDVYSKDFIVTQTNKDSKLTVLPVDSDSVECPVCKHKISSNEINRHLDECLNKDLIENISKDAINIVSKTNSEAIILNEPSVSNMKVIDNKNIESKVSDVNGNVKITQNDNVKIKPEKDFIDLTWINYEPNDNNDKIKSEIDSSDGVHDNICPCCGKKISKAIQEHLDECLVFFDNNATIPEEGASTSSMVDIVVLDDDDEFDETLTLNATGTKFPCPCCLEMVEQADMNNHLDLCLR